jgi:hypothetical protein
MAGAISNVSTVLEQARRAIPAVQGEVGIAGERKAAASRRFRAFAALAIIPAVVAVLGIGVSLELSKLQSETALATAQGEVARQTALVAELRQKGEADEAAYRTEITQETALVAGLRQQSEAKEAEYRAEISKQTALVADIRQRAEAALADAGIPIARGSPTSGPVHPANHSPTHGRRSVPHPAPLRFRPTDFHSGKANHQFGLAGVPNDRARLLPRNRQLPALRLHPQRMNQPLRAQTADSQRMESEGAQQ